jgi:excinuclease ABC subunit B
MYADRITGSMKAGIDETTRRRKVQEAYNKKHGITPTTVVKAIGDSRMSGSKKAIEDEEERKIDQNKMTVEEVKFYVDELEEQMDLSAKNLEFETAARLRDKIDEIKKLQKLRTVKK